MFGFSLPKILFTVAAIMAIWYGFKWIGRMQEQQKMQGRKQAKQAKKAAEQKPVWGQTRDPALDAEELVACAVCNTYVPAEGIRSCGRKDCPYPG